MNRRYGKARVPDCTCTSNFTCGACLRVNAAPEHCCSVCGQETIGVDCCGSDDLPEPSDIEETGP